MPATRKEVSYLWFGLWGGVVFGVGISAVSLSASFAFLLSFGFPGFLLSTLLLGPEPGFTTLVAIYCLLGNIAAYSVVGTLIGAVCEGLRKRRHKSDTRPPECLICGHRGLSYLSHTCPKCGRAISFEQRVELAEHVRLCRKCGYDLALNTSGVCPECGEPI